jgi:hypothetical protein
MNWKRLATHILLGTGVIGISIYVLLQTVSRLQEGSIRCQEPCQLVGPPFDLNNFLLILAIIGASVLIRIIIVDYLEPMLKKNGTD